MALGLLLLTNRCAAASPGWQPAVRLDSTNGAYPTVSWAPKGDLRIFYNIPGSPDRMVARQRPQAGAEFGSEVFVQNDGRAVAVHYGTGGTIDAAVATIASVVILQSPDDGASWLFKRTYPGRASADLTGYLTPAFAEDGAELRLAYGYQTSTLFGPLPETYQALRTGETWATSGTRVNTGEARGALEVADTVCVVASQGVLFSTNNGASFEVLGRTDPLPDQLMAADMAVGSSNRLYLLHSYSYGLAGQNQQLTFTHSDDLGATWQSPQMPIVTDSAQYMFAPRFAVDGQRIIVVWQHVDVPNQHQFVRCVMSSDAGETWGPIETVVSLTGTETLEINGTLDIASQGGRAALVYAVRDSGSPAGVFLKEWIADTASADVLRISHGTASPDATGVVISWDTLVGKTYQLFSKTNLGSSWPTGLIHQVTGDGSSKAYTNNEAGDQRYYRLGVVTP